MYLMGGMIPDADDALNSLSPTRRNAAFLIPVNNEDVRSLYFDTFYGSLDANGDFPGSSCHNHALVFEMGPLKSDWSLPCPSEWSQEKRQEMCISQNVAAWGTVNEARLIDIKRKIDPQNLFICVSGIGYGEEVEVVEGTAEPSPAPTTDKGEGTSDSSCTSFQTTLLSILFIMLLQI